MIILITKVIKMNVERIIMNFSANSTNSRKNGSSVWSCPVGGGAWWVSASRRKFDNFI